MRSHDCSFCLSRTAVHCLNDVAVTTRALVDNDSIILHGSVHVISLTRMSHASWLISALSVFRWEELAISHDTFLHSKRLHDWWPFSLIGQSRIVIGL